MAGGMIEVAKATVTIVPNMEGSQAEITKQLSSAGASAGISAGNTTGSNFASGFGKGLAAVGATTLAVGAATVATTKEIYNESVAVAEYGDSIDKNSQRLGMSVEAYQEWDYVLGISGTSMQDCAVGMKTLTNKIDDAKAGNAQAIADFEALGISLEDLNSMSREDIFAGVIAGFQDMEDSTERAALANDLFGKSGQNLTPLFNTTQEETAALIENVNALGGVMSEDAVKASADFVDSQTNMQTALNGLRNNMLGQFLPGLTSVNEGLSKVFSGDMSGIDGIQEGIESVVGTIDEVLPMFLEVGSNIVVTLVSGLTPMLPTLLESVIGAFSQILSALIAALPSLIPVIVSGLGMIVNTILQNLPLLITTAAQLILAIVQGLSQSMGTLIPTAIEAIMTIVDTLLENLDPLITASIDLITAIALGLIDALPELATRVPEIITQIVTTLLEHLPEIIDAAISIIGALTEGIIGAIPDLIAEIPGLITQIIEAFADLGVQLASNALTWATDMIDSFVSGITSGITKIGDAASDLANEVKDFIGFSEPKRGPLSNFHTYAPDMVDLFTEGLEESTPKIQASMESMLTIPNGSMASGLASVDGYEFSASDSGDASITIPVYIGQERLDTIVLRSIKTNTFRNGG